MKKNLKKEEHIVCEYLKKEYGENIIYEPYTNSTPDFELNSIIAVEVRRLNQHFLTEKKRKD